MSRLSPCLNIRYFFFAVLLTTQFAHAAEEGIGTLELTDIFMEPRFSFTEGKGGAFELGSSYVAVKWHRDSLISAVMKVGAKQLIGVPSRYAVHAPPDEIAVVEGYAQVDSQYGRVRMGLIPISFGLEGGDVERQLRFPRSLTFQSRFLGLRDLGVSYQIIVNGFFSDWAVHNGEGGTELDHESWFTARWGWANDRDFRVGMSGSTGRTRPASTDPGGLDNGTGFRVDESSRLRIANVFVDWAPKPVRLSAEVTAGDTFQGDENVKFRALHVDFDWHLDDVLAFLTRYNTMNPRNDVPNAAIIEYTAGFAWASRYENSVLYLLATKRVQENLSPDSHRGMLIWRITPMTSSFSGVL